MKAKLINSTYRQFAIIYFVIFCVSVLSLSWVTATITRSHFEGHLIRKMTQEVNQLLVDYRQDGMDELRHDLRERVELNQPERLYYSLILNDGTREFDNFPIADITDGWHDLTEPFESKILIISLKSEGKMVIASKLDDIHLLQRALANTYLAATLLTIVFGALGGVLLTRHYFKRISDIRDTAIKIGQGNLNLRLKVGTKDDIFDEIAVIMNAMIRRIELLVGESKRVASHIAHELRTPIGHVRQRVEAITQNNLQADAIQSEANLALKEIDKILDTFSAILRLSEINAGTRRVNFKEFNLGLLIEEICDIYEPIVTEEGKSIKWSTQDLSITGDISLMRQLLANMIENSIQHTPKGTAIDISIHQKEGKRLLIMKDNGPGISDIDFYRKPYTKADYGVEKSGAGLGLSLIEAIAKLHNFKITFENNHGFVITIQLN